MNPLFYAQQIAYSSKETLRFTYEMAKRFKDTPGVYVECGVAAGAQIIAMAHGAPNKTIYAFDSFEGIPLPSNRDDQMPGIKMLTKEEQMELPDPGKQVLQSSGATVVSYDDFLNHLSKSGINTNNIISVQGWFEELFPKWAPDGISILRLDGDLYNSTYVCLKHLYPRCINGACIIIDDWALEGARAAFSDYFGVEYYEMYSKMNFIISKYSKVAWWIK